MDEEFDEEKLQFIKQFDAGRYLKSLRDGRSLAIVCKELGVSTAYISEVERGRMPSDHFLIKAAAIYGIDEDDLFSRWGKIPMLAQREIKDNPVLLAVLSQIGRQKLSDTEKHELYDEIYKKYREFINKRRSKKEG